MKFTFSTDDVTKLSAGLLGLLASRTGSAKAPSSRPSTGARRPAHAPRRRGAVQGQEGPDAVAAHARARRRRSACSSSVAARAKTSSRPTCAASPPASSRPPPPRRPTEAAAVLPYLEGGASATTRARRAVPRRGRAARRLQVRPLPHRRQEAAVLRRGAADRRARPTTSTARASRRSSAASQRGERVGRRRGPGARPDQRAAAESRRPRSPPTRRRSRRSTRARPSTVLDAKKCAELGMGMFLAVGQGSDQEPRFIHMTYKPAKKREEEDLLHRQGRHVRLGRLLAQAVERDGGHEDRHVRRRRGDLRDGRDRDARLATYEVHAVAACCENLVSGRAYKLGDVLKSMDGTTVEINNTDAEGRLTLGDAITYARTKIQPDEMFDFATLTGACMVALGPYTAGVMATTRRSLSSSWLAVADRTGEDMWRLPLTDAPARAAQVRRSPTCATPATASAARSPRACSSRRSPRTRRGSTSTSPARRRPTRSPATSPKGGTGFAVATIVEYLAGRDVALLVARLAHKRYGPACRRAHCNRSITANQVTLFAGADSDSVLAALSAARRAVRGAHLRDAPRLHRLRRRLPGAQVRLDGARRAHGPDRRQGLHRGDVPAGRRPALGAVVAGGAPVRARVLRHRRAHLVRAARPAAQVVVPGALQDLGCRCAASACSCCSSTSTPTFMDWFFGALAAAAGRRLPGAALLARRRWKGAGWFAISFAGLLAVHASSAATCSAIALMYFIVAITWASGLGYLSRRRQAERARSRRHAGEIVRLVTSIVLPAWPSARSRGHDRRRGPHRAGVVRAGHGGLDNLLAHIAPRTGPALGDACGPSASCSSRVVIPSTCASRVVASRARRQTVGLVPPSCRTAATTSKTAASSSVPST